MAGSSGTKRKKKTGSVILLILITYYFGDAAAQGFAHDFAGLVMFMISILTIFAIDGVAGPVRRMLGNGSHD